MLPAKSTGLALVAKKLFAPPAALWLGRFLARGHGNHRRRVGGGGLLRRPGGERRGLADGRAAARRIAFTARVAVSGWRRRRELGRGRRRGALGRGSMLALGRTVD